MKPFAFISRHSPTKEQAGLAADLDIELIPVGDRDAFAFTIQDAEDLAKNYKGIICVHPLIAITALLAETAVGVFENANRAPVGEPPKFEASRLFVRAGVVVANAGICLATGKGA